MTPFELHPYYFPQSRHQDTTQVITQVKHILKAFRDTLSSRANLQESIGLKNREHFRKEYLEPLINDGFIERTIPEKPNSRLQKFRLTDKGRQSLDSSQNSSFTLA
jgi:predicted transcriptional regulator